MKRKRSRRMLLMVIALLGLGGVVWGGFSIYSWWQLRQLPSLSYMDALEYTTRNNEKARISVGIIQNGQMRYTVYGENATVLSPIEHVYEIGSLTKTFTASLLAKAILEDNIVLDDPISKHLPLPQATYIPTVGQLASHTSGYKNYYFAKKMIINFLAREANDFYGITSQTLRDQLEKIELAKQDYPFRYSNFGYAALGEVLEEVYGQNYRDLMNQFLREDLRLPDTRVSAGSGDLSGYWNWGPGDVYLSAGGLLSTITDMLVYCRLHMTEALPYLTLTQEHLAKVNTSSALYERLGIGLDAVGMSWIWDEKQGIYWHNGGTSQFNSYLAFDKEQQIGVVVLANLAPTYRIPATVLGAKLMEELQTGQRNFSEGSTTD